MKRFEDKAGKIIAYCLLLLFAGSATVVFLLVLNLANYIDLNI